MDGLGLDAAKDFQPIYLERAGDGPAMVLDGRVAALWGGGAGAVTWGSGTTASVSEWSTRRGMGRKCSRFCMGSS